MYQRELQQVQPGAVAGICAIHERHSPVPRYLEVHHYVPRAWQAYWHPPQAVMGEHETMVGGVQYSFEGPDTWRLVWDQRTINLCRTGHGNVHWWLVKAMRAYTSGATVDPCTLGLIEGVAVPLHGRGGVVRAWAVVDEADYALVGGRHWFLLGEPDRGYAVANEHRGATVYMHRLLMGATQKQLVDHKNNVGIDNRRANLRFATKVQNARNSDHARNGSVTYDKRTGLYRASVQHERYVHDLGRHTSETAARQACREWLADHGLVPPQDGPPPWSPAEVRTALEAMLRWLEWGGDLVALRKRGLLGQI